MCLVVNQHISMKNLAYFFVFWLFSLSYEVVAQHNDTRYAFAFSAQDSPVSLTILAYLNNGVTGLETFFADSFQQTFEVRLHPHRSQMDSVWQTEWQMPEFHSECWMVASGVGTKLDLLDPNVWSVEACEHRWEDTLASFRLLTHELCHVYHGQHNPSPDFSQVTGLDWFVEGLAVYASGQCDVTRLTGVQQWLKPKEPLQNLDVFWSGKHKYGLSGSMVMYIDQTYGRQALIQLLKLQTKTALLATLHCTESGLLSAWDAWIRQSQW